MAAAPPRTPGVRATAQERRERAERLLALFAWHRDAPLVARSLGLSLDELHEQLDELRLRRKAYRLVRGSPFDVPVAKPLERAHSGPPVRRRPRPAELEPAPRVATELPPNGGAAEPAPQTQSTAASPPAAANAVAEQRAQLVALLAKVGARRAALAERLGTKSHPLPERVLLARFRAAGLERELGQRERDLLRGLFARHRGDARAVANDLAIDEAALQRLVRDRGLSAEIAALRERVRAPGRRRRAPHG